MTEKDFDDWYAKVGSQLVELEVAKSVFELLRGVILGKVTRERNRYRKALKKIRRMNPADSPEGYNEWGEAYCFQRAQDLAGEALMKPTKPAPYPPAE